MLPIRQRGARPWKPSGILIPSILFQILNLERLPIRAVIRTVQELLGQKDVTTTMNYTLLLNHGGRGVQGGEMP